MISWIVSRSRARDPRFWHIQARTADQLSSFACTVFSDTNLLRTKAADGKADVFTLSQLEPHVTFNCFGKIKYEGEWES